MRISILTVFIISLFCQEDQPDSIYVVDNFDQALSESWQGRYTHFRDAYRVLSEGEDSFLSAKSDDDDCFIIKKIDVDIVEYPYLNWRWRINQLPEMGDESVKARCDVAASLAVVLNKSRFFPRSIKYSWSSTLPKGTKTESPFAMWPARCDVCVLGSGATRIGEWVDVKVNVLEDYLRLYDKEDITSKNIHALVIMTDSDNTGTPAEADYDDIYFSKY